MEWVIDKIMYEVSQEVLLQVMSMGKVKRNGSNKIFPKPKALY